MKKLFLSMFLSCLMILAAFAQDPMSARKDIKKGEMLALGGDSSISNIPYCFCCENAFNMPLKPYIKGAQTINCGTQTSYSISNCPGASVNWTVSPSISGVSGGSSNVFTIPATAPAGTYTITVTLRCGNKTVSNSVVLVIKEVQGCSPAFTITVVQQTNGFLNINAVPAMLTPGQEHWWGIQYNGTYPNCTIPCTSIPFTSFTTSGVYGGYINASGVLTPYMGTGITTGTTPYGINYSGFPNNSCFKITHYVKCCGVLVRQTQCVSIGTTNLRMINPGEVKPDITIGQIETSDIKN